MTFDTLNAIQTYVTQSRAALLAGKNREQKALTYEYLNSRPGRVQVY